MLTEKPSVLIVDESEDSREVLRTVLRRQGLDIFEASQAEQGLRMVEQHRPTVTVLDLEFDADIEADEAMCGQYRSCTGEQEASLVVLGRASRGVKRGDLGPSPDRSEFFSKPYHYGDVIRKIEELLR